jgi:tetratricopeptide (TPR) repeat protein
LNRLEHTPEALELLTAALEKTRAQGNEFWGAQARYALGRALIAKREYGEALRRLDEVDAVWRANAAANVDRLADLSRTRAELELARGDVAAAAAHVDRSLSLFGYPAASRTPELPAALALAARIQLQLARPDQAYTYAAAALRISESVARTPQHSADVGEALLVMAAAQGARGDRSGARSSVQRAAQALRSSLGENHRLSIEAADLRRSLEI